MNRYTLVLIAVILALLGVGSYFLHDSWRKVADLERQLQRSEEEQQQKIEDARLEASRAARAEADARIAKMQDAIDDLQQSMADRELAYRQYLKRLGKVTDWDRIQIVEKKNSQ